jgi:hypothetical protein
MTDSIVSIEAFAKSLARRRRRLGLADRPTTPNSGKFRTPNKRALLMRIAERARAQGRSPHFPANF